MLAMHRVIHRVHFAVLLARLGGIRFVFVFVQLLPLQPAFFSCLFAGMCCILDTLFAARRVYMMSLLLIFTTTDILFSYFLYMKNAG
jgi:hypothetical protein